MDAQQRREPTLNSPEGDTPSPSTSREQRLPAYIGRYRILGRLGAGGMGTVYKAFDPQLERIVALKVPNFHEADEDSAVLSQRFLREARAAALIHHPHVCPIFDVGETEGRPFAVMAYVEGQSLAERLRGGRCYDPASAVHLVREVADALEAVHARGLLHRDLKPGNILLDQEGHAFLTDFGLARPRLDAERLTADGALLGTPAFMAPEQAAGQTDRIGPCTDVYGLGVVLYRLLTGRLPYLGDAITVLWKIGNEAPPAPSSLRPDLDPELEAIVLRAMARQPEERYASAHEMSVALRQWLTGRDENTWTAPPSLPPAAEAPGPSTVALTPTTTRPDQAPALPATLPGAQPSEAPRTETPAPQAGPSRRRPRVLWTAAALSVVLVGTVLIALAIHPTPGTPALRKEDEGEQRQEVPKSLVQPEEMGWPERGPLSDMALVSHPSRLAGVHSWTVETRFARGPLQALAQSPNGEVLAAAGDDGMVRLWQAGTRRLLRLLVGHGGRVRGLAWSPDGRYLASAGDDKTIRLWDADSGQPLRILHGHTDAVCSVAWSPDGVRLASAGKDTSLRLWRARDGKPVQTLAHSSPLLHVAWSPDGKVLATAGRGLSIRLWDAASGRLLRELQKDTLPLLFAIAFSPDGKVLASAGQDGQLRLWDVATGQALHEIATAPPVLALAWSPRGDRLATANLLTVQSWDARGQPLQTIDRPDEQPVAAICWSRDGKTLTTAGADGTVRSYEEATGKAGEVIPAHPVGPAAVTWSPGGDRLAVSGLGDGRLRLWSVGQARLHLPEGKVDPVAAWAPDGTLLAVAGADASVRLWDTEQKRWLSPLRGHTSAVTGLAWSPNSKLLVSVSPDGAARIWDMPAGKPRQVLPSGGDIFAVTWSEDNAQLAIGLHSGPVQIWRVGQNKPAQVLEEHGALVRALAWSPDGRVLASADALQDGFVLLRSLQPARRLRPLPVETFGAFALAWSPDSKWLAAGGCAGLLWIWSADGAQVHKLQAHTGPVSSLAWSSAGDMLASAGRDGTVRLWAMASLSSRLQKPRRGPVLVPLAAGESLVVSPEGHWAGSPDADKQLVAVVQTDSGQQLLSLDDFAAAYPWKNDPSRAIPGGE